MQRTASTGTMHGHAQHGKNRHIPPTRAIQCETAFLKKTNKKNCCEGCLPRCKKLRNLSLVWSDCFPALYCFEVLCCLGRFFFLITGEFHRFLIHRG